MMRFPRSYWEKLTSTKSVVGNVGKIADTPKEQLSPAIMRKSDPCRHVGAKNDATPENANSADTLEQRVKTRGIMRKSTENGCRQKLPTLPTPRSYKVHFPASFLEKVEFWASDDVGNCRRLEVDECATCRHWRPNPPRLDRVTRKPIKNESYCDRCQVNHAYGHCPHLVFVTKHVYGTAFEKGDVLTMDELRVHGLTNVEYLNTGPHFYCHMYEAKEAADADAA